LGVGGAIVGTPNRVHAKAYSAVGAV